MKQYWNIKMIYPSGGHLLRDANGHLLRFDSKQNATFECETLNSKKTDYQAKYIPVVEE